MIKYFVLGSLLSFVIIASIRLNTIESKLNRILNRVLEIQIEQIKFCSPRGIK